MKKNGKIISFLILSLMLTGSLAASIASAASTDESLERRGGMLGSFRYLNEASYNGADIERPSAQDIYQFREQRMEFHDNVEELLNQGDYDNFISFLEESDTPAADRMLELINDEESFNSFLEMHRAGEPGMLDGGFEAMRMREYASNGVGRGMHGMMREDWGAYHNEDGEPGESRNDDVSEDENSDEESANI